jgi:hypothetical protein
VLVWANLVVVGVAVEVVGVVDVDIDAAAAVVEFVVGFGCEFVE